MGLARADHVDLAHTVRHGEVIAAAPAHVSGAWSLQQGRDAPRDLVTSAGHPPDIPRRHTIAPMAESICVNFGKPIALFPLPAIALLPHAVQHLHIFEKRYRQMIDQCLDSSGQIAMACFAGEAWKSDYEGTPPLRPAVCIGQIVQHMPLADGRHDILVQGICRARIVRLLEPEDDRLYRQAMVLPLEPVDCDPPPMGRQRHELRRLLAGRPLRRLRNVDKLLEWFDHKAVPTHALLELIGFTLLMDGELRYRLLAEPKPARRADIIQGELHNLEHLIRLADLQSHRSWPKGMSWN